MAQAVQTQRWQRSIVLSPMQRWEQAVAKVRYSTSPQRAAELGKQLVGQWPHANPPDPRTYSLSIAKILEQFPLGVAEECCDPTAGLAKHREFPPTVAAVQEWCNLTTRAYVAIAERMKPADAKPEREFSEGHRKTMLQRLMGLWKSLKTVPQ